MSMAREVAELRLLNAELQRENAELRAAVVLLQQRISELEERLGKNSRNSSKPQSSDPAGTGRRTTKRVNSSLRSAAGRGLAGWADWAAGRISREQLLTQVAKDRKQVKRMLDLAAAAPAARKTRRICAEILKHEACLWVFLEHPVVPPTNNLAERLLRHTVLWRKGCFGTDSPDGSRFNERILTLIASLRLQGRGRTILDALSQTYIAHARGLPPPSILPLAQAAGETVTLDLPLDMQCS